MWNKQTAALFPVHYTEIYSVRVSEKNSKIDSSKNARFHCNWCFHSGLSHVLFVSYFHFLENFFFGDLDWLDSQRIYFFWHHWGKFLIIFTLFPETILVTETDKKFVVNITVSVNKTSKAKNVNRGCLWLFLPSQIFSTGKSWSNPPLKKVKSLQGWLL